MVACGREASSDSRALPGSAPDGTLAKALQILNLTLPESAQSIRFGIFASIDTGVELKFDAACEDAEGFVAAASLPELGSVGDVPTAVASANDEFAWGLTLIDARGTERNEPTQLPIVAVGVSGTSSNLCRYVVTGYR
jgi:hypothetical protein